MLAQTCQDFEIIVVDDASTDGTAAAVAALADRRITLIRHERNRGGSAARNTGIRAGSAAYVAFLDSDDEWMPTKLERQLEVFERSGDGWDSSTPGAERVFADGSVSRHIPRRPGRSRAGAVDRECRRRNVVGMVRRSAFERSAASTRACRRARTWISG